LPRAGIVHRLDKDTSGLLLVAKTEVAHVNLSRQLKARTMHRRYLAVLEGHLPLDTGTIDVPLGRHLTHRKEMAVRHVGGRAARTRYRVVARFELITMDDAASGTPCTLVDVALETGRTHQIRVHMAHLGHPVVGDTTYGKRPSRFWASLGVSRHLLHAYRLTLRHPVSGLPMAVTAPIPTDMARHLPPERRMMR
jgi:23S rRNA pseudouridine1911/1915/1917 synthase